MTNKLIYTIEFEAPEEARVAECLYLIQGIRQEARDRLPQDWKVRMRFGLGVQERNDQHAGRGRGVHPGQ